MNNEERRHFHILRIPEQIDKTVSVDADARTAKFQEQLQKARLRSFEQWIELKEKFSKQIFYLTIGWLIVVLAIVVFKGYELFGFDLSDNVIMTLIGSTTANILGLLVIILKYVFSPHKLDRFDE